MGILESILKIVDARIAKLDTHALYEGVVIKQTSAGLLEVKLDDSRFGPGFQHLEIAFGLPGVVEVEVPKGTRVAVGFLEGKRDKPIVRHWISGTPLKIELKATQSITITSPVLVELGEEPRMGVARMGDPVQAGPWPGTITSASLRVRAGL
jgi:hypothetical protein